MCIYTGEYLIQKRTKGAKDIPAAYRKAKTRKTGFHCEDFHKEEKTSSGPSLIQTFLKFRKTS